MSAAKFLFAGTPEFALASLRALVENGDVPEVVLTQPDRPAGRGRKLTASPVKKFAVDNSIPVWQPGTLKEPAIAAEIAELQLDLMVVAAYGLILPAAILAAPRLGCINVHASLLPRWRGAAPIQNAILKGDNETGISLMQMEAGLDTGPVFVTAATTIGEHENAGELHDRLAVLGGDLLVKNFARIAAGDLQASPQDDALATYAAKINKADARILWHESALENSRKIRAYNPVPGAAFELDDEVVRCFVAEIIAADAHSPNDDANVGRIVAAGRDGIDVVCGTGILRMKELQRPGRKRINAAEFTAQVNPLGKRLGRRSGRNGGKRP